MGVVIDTNVLVVANWGHEDASPSCVEQCIRKLEQSCRARVFIDDEYHILDEYRRHCSLSGQPGVGDAFFKWLWDNQGNEKRCRMVGITPHEERGFEVFPDDPQLTGFDRSDRKFVAVAIASGDKPPILNATDTDWWNYRLALERNGVTIVFLCPELMCE